MAPRRPTPKKPRRVTPVTTNTTSFKGRNLGGHFQAAVYNLYKYFRRERLNGGPLRDVKCVHKRVCEALHIGKSTLIKIKNKAAAGEPFITPSKTRNMKRGKREVDGFTKSAIRRLIYELHAKREHITVQSLHEKIKERGIDFRGEVETLRKVLHDLKFRFKKRNGVRFLQEQPRIVQLRLNFLRRFRKIHQENKKCRVYLDETWVFRRGSDKTKAWQDEDIRSCPTRHADSGGRYVVIHAGGREGFVSGARKLFPTKEKPLPEEDYHGDMDGQLFKGWFTDMLLPGLTRPTVIIMDNAPYHSCQARH